MIGGSHEYDYWNRVDRLTIGISIAKPCGPHGSVVTPRTFGEATIKNNDTIFVRPQYFQQVVFQFVVQLGNLRPLDFQMHRTGNVLFFITRFWIRIYDQPENIKGCSTLWRPFSSLTHKIACLILNLSKNNILSNEAFRQADTNLESQSIRVETGFVNDQAGFSRKEGFL